MKIQQTIALLACLCFYGIQATAQAPVQPNHPDYNKPKRFADLPESQAFNLSEAVGLLDLPVGAKATLTLAKNMVLSGVVVSKSDPQEKSLKTVVLRSTNRPGTAFTFTRLAEKGGSYSYTGRLLNRNASDAVELTSEGGVYQLRKKGYYEMISE